MIYFLDAELAALKFQLQWERAYLKRGIWGGTRDGIKRGWTASAKGRKKGDYGDRGR
jgi:hypothetical protein